ncbi:hypothetical protein Acr_00g0083540 [Actinidia rufa]|uniref:Zinc-ribbon domain-containing protein n=1 Tax=Actinidia rufa TaxID=165716 RepID=A0A7J0DWQ6_9ERIC|nr:hypothetical protein Acr_00g0083540 [Actinidia rufa]
MEGPAEPWEKRGWGEEFMVSADLGGKEEGGRRERRIGNIMNRGKKWWISTRFGSSMDGVAQNQQQTPSKHHMQSIPHQPQYPPLHHNHQHPVLQTPHAAHFSHNHQCGSTSHLPEISHAQQSPIISQHMACLQPLSGGHLGERLHVLPSPAKFCDECGAPYLRETSKFCSECGVKRLGA